MGTPSSSSATWNTVPTCVSLGTSSVASTSAAMSFVNVIGARFEIGTSVAELVDTEAAPAAVLLWRMVEQRTSTSVTSAAAVPVPFWTQHVCPGGDDVTVTS
jgi:hypothetical protein